MTALVVRHGRKHTTLSFDRLVDQAEEARGNGQHVAVIEYWLDGEDDEQYGRVVYIEASTDDELDDAVTESITDLAIASQRHV